MNDTTLEGGAAAWRETDTEKGASALAALAAALAKVFEQGLAQYRGQAEAVAQALERQVAAGASLQYVVRLAPGELLRVRCYVVSASSEDDPVPLFEVQTSAELARRLLN
jgi:hypothetical protein